MITSSNKFRPGPPKYGEFALQCCWGLQNRGKKFKVRQNRKNSRVRWLHAHPKSPTIFSIFLNIVDLSETFVEFSSLLGAPFGLPKSHHPTRFHFMYFRPEGVNLEDALYRKQMARRHAADRVRAPVSSEPRETRGRRNSKCPIR